MTTLSVVPSLSRRLLTAPGEPWELSKEQREIMALTEDGILYVSGSHQNDLHVMALCDRLDRAGMRYKFEAVDPDEINRFYRAGSITAREGFVGDDERATHNQAEVIKIIREACEQRASDIHFIVAPDGRSKIRFRIDGLLTTVIRPRYQQIQDLCSTIYQSMCDVADPLFQPHLSQDARISKSFVDQLGLFGARVSTRPRAPGFLMVLRLLSNDSSLDSLEDLGYLPEQIVLFQRMLSLPYGMNILSGPTGSGKSMTLKVVLEMLDQMMGGAKHILTIEDPPEYSSSGEGINQTPLVYDATDPQAEIHAWAAGISNGMRLDPDFMMIGEIREIFAAIAAFRGAMTGHGMWSTLHTNTAIGILQRLQDLGVDPSLLFDPALLTGMINQSLLPKLCKHCRVPFLQQRNELDAALVHRIETMCTPATVFVRGPGCSHCRDTGFSGRSVVAEVLMPTLRFVRKFREGGPAEARNYWVQHMSGITKHEHTVRRINEGIFDPAASEKVIGPLDMDLYLLDAEEER
ncbi:GspE/PulE family protein [Pseudomonas chlororaphis]|uniref:GspE/PulE family protein n=1 Tax=Pseudomonas chlororaphis TaxID=587753 RepID=UPI00192973A5|nr:ATPase, T2SS/T4P/T4SS family [Pseudomonas chlororaphis]QQX57545.1 Flp pilus assembly complex ATPase component TadA [Pseudomonas chlororaphis subsp. aurantiaca]